MRSKKTARKSTSIFQCVHVHRWEDLIVILEKLEDYLFRGVAGHEWKLLTSLERETPTASTDGAHFLSYEHNILYEFARRAHHYNPVPLSSSISGVELVALLRHYGGPTRLLDVSYSPYVALYFALESFRLRATSSTGPTAGSPAIWAFSREALQSGAGKVLGALGASTRADEAVENAFHEVRELGRTPNRGQCVLVGEPLRLNDRMAAQQGTFLIPYTSSRSFEENLLGPFQRRVNTSILRRKPGRSWKRFRMGTPVVKLVLGPGLIERGMMELHRMNITAASLYPGLDGFARSLTVRLRHEFPSLHYEIAPSGKV